jgi:hypothetical protein
MEIDMETFQKIGIKIDTSLTALVTEYRFIKKNAFRRPTVFVNPLKFTKHQQRMVDSARLWAERNSSNKSYMEALDINNQKAKNLLNEFEVCLKETK